MEGALSSASGGFVKHATRIPHESGTPDRRPMPNSLSP